MLICLGSLLHFIFRHRARLNSRGLSPHAKIPPIVHAWKYLELYKGIFCCLLSSGAVSIKSAQPSAITREFVC